MSDESCLFCKMIAKKIPTQVVLDDEHAFGFRDIRPQAPTHVLVVPKKHIPAVAEASEDDALVLGRTILAAKRVAKELGLEDDGYRLVINNGENAGQSVFHIHVHVLGGRPFGWPPG